jgi:Lrp/AsnC family transcriptional regulator for asnA, asnC and gidA
MIIDSKDRKILYYLLQDSRMPLKTLSKKVGSSRESTSYRLKRLVKNKIILTFNVNLNVEKLGYSVINIYFNFRNINPDKKKEIIEYFINHKLTTYVSLIEGKYDFQIETLMGDPYEYESYFDELEEKYHKYLLLEKTISWIRGEDNNYKFLLNNDKDEIKFSNWSWGKSLHKIDDLDFQILSELYKNSRLPTKKIANNIGSTISIVNYRIKNLIKNDIITNFTIHVDWLKIGYRWFHLQINLNDYSKKTQILSYIKKNPNLVRILKGFQFNISIHCTYLLHDVTEMRKIIEDITSKFPNSIEEYNFYSTFKVFKHYYFIPKPLKYKNPLNRGHLF